MISITALTVPTAAHAGTRASCDGKWHRTGYFMGEKYSPWIRTVNGIGFKRKIQFRTLGGVVATRGRVVGARCEWTRALFWSANYARTTSCMKAMACRVSDWFNPKPPKKGAGYRWPNHAVGWDPFAFRWRVWKI